MKFIFRLSTMLLYLLGIYIVLGSNTKYFVSTTDILQLFIGTLIFYCVLYVDRHKNITIRERLIKAIFWSGFFVSIIKLLSLFDHSYIHINADSNTGLVFLILSNCRPVLYAISIIILLYQNETKNDNAKYSSKLESLDQLSNRENEIVELIVLGKTNNEIADTLCISPFTVKKHVYNIFSKLNISQRSEIKYLVNSKKPTN